MHCLRRDLYLTNRQTRAASDSGEDEMTADQTTQEKSNILPAGTPAPLFTLNSTPDKSYSLSDFKGKPLVLAFYPADWSPVCGDQIALYNEMREEFSTYQAQIVGISVDGVWCHKAFADARRIHFPLLSDFEPKGEISRRYGVYDDKSGISERALFVIDANGVIAWSYLSPIRVNPGADGIFRALDELTASKAQREAEQSARTTTRRLDERNEGEASAP
jgi:peroxiredoxin